MSRCVVCGKRITFGSEHCADGKICRRCWDKISENLNGIRSLPARKLRAHVAWRQQIIDSYPSFKPTSVCGDFDCLHVDNLNKRFAVSLETRSLKYKPDIFSFSELLGYCLDVKDENGSIDPYGPRLSPAVYKHRATCRFTPPPELPVSRAQESVPPESRYINDGERDTRVSVYLYLNNPWVPFIRMFITKRPCGSPGTRSYNKAVATARGIIAVLKDILSENGSVLPREPAPSDIRPRGPLGPNPVFAMPAPPSVGRPDTFGGFPPPRPASSPAYGAPRQQSTGTATARQSSAATSYKPVKCPVCGAMGQTGRACEYCGTVLR